MIRVSGPAAVEMVDRLFRGSAPLCTSSGHTLHFGTFSTPQGRILDQVLASLFLSPHSYTGEDSVEISCHGGSLITGEIIRAILDSGARPADPGEFTRRAFLNGKIDLTQAEAVADLIAARSQIAERASAEQLAGSLGNLIKEMKSRLLSLCSRVELGLDFAEEGIELLSIGEIEQNIENEIKLIDDLISSHARSRIFRDGISTAIVGRPNVGKSSLFNSLLLSERAIVTHIPGTTRDTIEESVQINGVLFRLVDTAGVRDSADIVESEGIRRTLEAMQSSDILVLVTDEHGPDSRLDINFFLSTISDDQKYIVVRNKVDLLPSPLVGRSPEVPHEVWVSATTGRGIADLQALLFETALGPAGIIESHFLVNERHRAVLTRARDSLLSALESAGRQTPGEFIALDIRACLESLGEITGEVTTDDILDRIFSSFCIGK